MKSYYKKAQEYLEVEPLARKVENRSTAVWNLIKHHHNPVLDSISKREFTYGGYFKMIQSFDRAIRDVQQDHPELSDPENEENKKILSQAKQEELGYEAGLEGSVKKLKTLV